MSPQWKRGLEHSLRIDALQNDILALVCVGIIQDNPVIQPIQAMLAFEGVQQSHFQRHHARFAASGSTKSRSPLAKWQASSGEVVSPTRPTSAEDSSVITPPTEAFF